VEVEVGFGKGLFLLNSALKHPEVNFFGIEVIRKLQLYAATRLAIRHLTNAKLACADAQQFVQGCIPDGSVQTVHVYFPDPWWKKRHKKRRVFTEDFAAGAARILRPQGLLSIATDVEEYFGVMTEIVTKLPAFELISQSREETQGEKVEMTNFERKAHEQGRTVHRAVYRNRS
jgi:tRNA (guanine-N7-)-methyltransferase